MAEAILEALSVAPAGSFALIGAWARNAWAPPRATTDIDLVVLADCDTLDAIGRALVDAGYAIVRDQRVEAADDLPDIRIYRAADGEPKQVDLLVAKTEFEAQALRRAEQVDLAGLSIPVITPEDLVVYKLLANRMRDQDDVRTVVRAVVRSARPFDWEHVERWSVYWGIEARAEQLRAELGVER